MKGALEQATHRAKEADNIIAKVRTKTAQQLVEMRPCHLRELNRAGLAQMEKQGKTIQRWVDPKVFTELASFFVFTESK